MARRSNYNDTDFYSRDRNFSSARNPDNDYQLSFGGSSGGNQSSGFSRNFDVNAKSGSANDRSTMDERKEFFRQLGLPRYEVYEYAVRSFESPSFDLDYFEYRRHNLLKQRLNEVDIKRQLLNEVRNSLQEPSSGFSNFQQNSSSNRKVPTPPPPPPNIRDFLSKGNVNNYNQQGNIGFNTNQNTNQRYQQLGSSANFDKDRFGNNNIMNQNWPQSNSNEASKNWQQKQPSSNWQTNSAQQFGTSSYNWNQNSKPQSTAQASWGQSSFKNIPQLNPNQNSIQSSWQQGITSKQATQTNWNQTLDNSNWRQTQSSQSVTASSNRNLTSAKPASQSNWERTAPQQMQTQVAPPIPSLLTSNFDNNNLMQQKFNQSKPFFSNNQSISDYKTVGGGNPPNKFNNGGNFNNMNRRFTNNTMNIPFNNPQLNNSQIEPDLEEQVNGIVVQALQHIAKKINQPTNQINRLMQIRKEPMKAKLKIKNQKSVKASKSIDIPNPFMIQREKSFREQFKKFDCCALLTKRPESDRQDLAKALSFLKDIKKLPKTAIENEKTSSTSEATAAKKLKEDSQKDEENGENTVDAENNENTGDAENNENTENVEIPENLENTENVEITENDENTENCEITENTENGENSTEKEQNEEDNKKQKFIMKRKRSNRNSISYKKVKVLISSEDLTERVQKEFVSPEEYGEDFSKSIQQQEYREYITWFKEYRWVKNHIKQVEDHDPEIRQIFFYRQREPKDVNNKKIIECEQAIAKALKIQEERFYFKEAYEFLKARAIYNQFLYVIKKSYLSHEGLRALQQIYDHLLTANTVGFYKGIIKKFAMIYGKDGNEAKKKQNQKLLADKAFHWLVRHAFIELKHMFTRHSLKERLNALYKNGCFIDKRMIENAKCVYRKIEFAEKDVKALANLLEKKPEINWRNCKEFMRRELRVVNKEFNKFLEGDAVEERNTVLAKLESEPYVENVHIYMVRKLMQIYDRVKYLENVHPRMISRHDLKQLIAFRKFLAVEDIKLMVKHILDEWLNKYGDFTKDIYKKLIPIRSHKTDDADDNDNDETDKVENADVKKDNEATLNDDDITVLDDGTAEQQIIVEVDENNDENEQVPETVDLLTDDDDDENGDGDAGEE